MSNSLANSLLIEEVVSPAAAAEAFYFAIKAQVPLVRALIETGAVRPDSLDRFLARSGATAIERVPVSADLVERLPEGLCQRLLAVPLRRDPVSGAIDVVVADPTDPHAAKEIGFHLGAKVRVVRSSIAVLEDALGIPKRARSQPPRRPSTQPPKSRRSDAPATVREPPPSSRGAKARRDSSPSSSPASGSDVPLPLIPRRKRRNTPTWGTPHEPEPPPKSAPPPSSSSDIPIPLTRRAPFGLDPLSNQLGEGYPVEPEQFRDVVEIRSDARIRADQKPASEFPGPPLLPGENAAATSRLRRVADISTALLEIRHASSREEVIDLLLAAAQAVSSKVALFALKRGDYWGWSCTTAFGDQKLLECTMVPADAESIFGYAIQDGFYAGKVPRDDVHSALLAVLAVASRDVAIVPIVSNGRASMILVAAGVTPDDPHESIKRLVILASGAGDAFARVARERHR